MTLKDLIPKDEEGQQSKYSLEDRSGAPISTDDFEVPLAPSNTELFFDAVSKPTQARRHASMRIERNDAATEEI